MARRMMDSSNNVTPEAHMGVKNTTSAALQRQASRGQGVAISKAKKTALLKPGAPKQRQKKIPRNTGKFPG